MHELRGSFANASCAANLSSSERFASCSFARSAARFAAFVYSKAGHLETSIRMWEEIAESAEQPYMREMAERYLVKLRAQAALERAKGARSSGATEPEKRNDDI